MFIDFFVGEYINPLTYRGDEYIGCYFVDDRYFYSEIKLAEDNKLYYSEYTDFGYIAGGCSDGHVCYEYDYAKIPYQYNGSLFIIKQDNNFSIRTSTRIVHPWWASIEAFELVFKEGLLIERIDWTKTMLDISNQIKNDVNFEEDFNKNFNMIEFVKNITDYKNIWWIDNILNNVNMSDAFIYDGKGL